MKNLFIKTLLPVSLVVFSLTISFLSFAQQNPIVGNNIGNKAPELSFKDTSGNIISLSSIKGKLVLIDFWASWCGPCRMENPNVVNAYQMYKNKKFTNGNGFTIYSVSLDADKNAWEKAIIKDKLAWSYHVSELAGWRSSAAALYGVFSIPMNFLIDKNGIIIAKNLRGVTLGAELEKYVR